MNRTRMKTRSFLAILTGLLLIAFGLPALAQPTPPPLPVPELSVGVLSRDPGYGPRWSTNVFPFGNYIGPQSGQDVFCRTYLRFAISSVPENANVHATLYVYVDDYWPGPGGAPISVYPVLEEWTPETVDWYDMAAWPELGQAVATTQVTSDGGWFTWEISGLVREWGTGARPDYGLALAAANLYSTADNWAAARRLTADDPGTRPYMALYIEVPTTATPGTPLPTSPTATQPATPTAPPPPTAQPATPTAQPPPPTPPPPPPTATPAFLPPLLPESGGSSVLPMVILILVWGGVGVAVAGVLRRGLANQSRAQGDRHL